MSPTEDLLLHLLLEPEGRVDHDRDLLVEVLELVEVDFLVLDLDALDWSLPPIFIAFTGKISFFSKRLVSSL